MQPWAVEHSLFSLQCIVVRNEVHQADRQEVVQRGGSKLFVWMLQNLEDYLLLSSSRAKQHYSPTLSTLHSVREADRLAHADQPTSIFSAQAGGGTFKLLTDLEESSSPIDQDTPKKVAC
jgi:hypothetical protein